MIVRHKYHSIKNPTVRLIFVSLAASLMLLGSFGCKGANVVNSNNEQTESNESSPDNQDNQDNQNNPDDADAQTNTGPEYMDEQGHGTTAEERNLLEPGYMNGSWRVATGEQDQPAVHFDTFQDQGKTNVTGTYVMGFAIYERLDGESGPIETASFDGDTLTILWNPTSDREEMLTLKATRVDKNTLEGSVTAKRNTQMNIPVTITRQIVE